MEQDYNKATNIINPIITERSYNPYATFCPKCDSENIEVSLIFFVSTFPSWYRIHCYICNENSGSPPRSNGAGPVGI